MSTGDISKSKIPPAMRWGSALTFAIIGISGSIRLITAESSSVGLVSVTLVSLCALLIIFFGDSVDWFDLKNLKVQMRKVEESKKEVEELAYLTVRLIVLSQEGSLTFGRTKETDQDFARVAKDILRKSGASDADELFQKIAESNRSEVEAV